MMSPPPGKGKKGDDNTALIGGIVGAVAGALLLTGLTFFLCKFMRGNSESDGASQFQMSPNQAYGYGAPGMQGGANVQMAEMGMSQYGTGAYQEQQMADGSYAQQNPPYNAQTAQVYPPAGPQAPYPPAAQAQYTMPPPPPEQQPYAQQQPYAAYPPQQGGYGNTAYGFQ